MYVVLKTRLGVQHYYWLGKVHIFTVACIPAVYCWKNMYMYVHVHREPCVLDLTWYGRGFIFVVFLDLEFKLGSLCKQTAMYTCIFHHIPIVNLSTCLWSRLYIVQYHTQVLIYMHTGIFNRPLSQLGVLAKNVLVLLALGMVSLLSIALISRHSHLRAYMYIHVVLHEC